MKRRASKLLLLFVSALVFSTLLFSEASNAFELCFAYAHGRCFKTNETSTKRSTLQQYGGLSDSEAVITPQEIKALEKDIATFYTNVKYAAVKSAKSCGKPLVYRVSKKEDIRCLDRMKKGDNDKLLSLITRISLASKP